LKPWAALSLRSRLFLLALLPLLTSIALIAFAVSLSAVWALSSGLALAHIVDRPNARSLHRRPTPRSGGVGIACACAIAWLAAGRPLPVLAALAAALAVVSLIDDVRGLPVRARLAAHLLASGAFALVYPPEPVLWMPVVVVTLMWMTNLYNFMDGSDGLAGGMAVSGFGAYALAAHWSGAGDIAALSSIVGAAAMGFLVWNAPPARIFMGDMGSIPLGFLAAALGALGWQRGIWPMWLPPLVFAPFIVDASLTIVRRWRRGERLSEAHRSHFYQRANAAGLGHRGTALWGLALMTGTALSALALRTADGIVVAVALAAWSVAFALILRWIDRRWAAHSNDLTS